MVVLKSGTQKMLGGVVGPHDRKKRIVRGLLVCEIGVNHGERFTVAVTHLDHMSRAEREVQMSHVVEVLELHRRPLVLMGDLNTLRRYFFAHTELCAVVTTYFSCAPTLRHSNTPPTLAGLDPLTFLQKSSLLSSEKKQLVGTVGGDCI